VTTPQDVATSPVRDRPTWLVYLQLSSWAWFLYAFGATQALLRDEQGTSKSVAALHGSSFAVGGLIGALATAPAIRMLGRGMVMRITAIGTAASMLLYTTPNAAPWVTMTAACLACLFGTALLITINAFLLDHQGTAGAAAITEANAFAAFATLLGPLAVGIGVATVFGWRAGIWTAMIGMLAPEFEEVVTGEAEVREVFRIPRVGAIAGCYVREGTITRGSKVRFLRDGTVIWKGAINSLKRFKDDVKEVARGYECGLSFANYNDLVVGDVVECFDIEMVPG
jgi:MFS family permease